MAGAICALPLIPIGSISGVACLLMLRVPRLAESVAAASAAHPFPRRVALANVKGDDLGAGAV